MTTKATTSHRTTPADRTVELLELLDKSMLLWSRRSVEPAELVERTLDDLHRSWAVVRFRAGDNLTIDPAPAGGRAARRRDVHHTGIARGHKAVEDEFREKFIVTRYAKEIRKGRSPKHAREIVAEEIREGRHLPPMRQVELDYRPAAYGATYSEKSVARVLRKYSADQ
jgi:hypothetical protein